MYAEKHLNMKVSDGLHLTLLDHIDFLLKRAEQGQFVKNPLYWNVKRFYPKAFAVGLHSLRMIELKTKLSLPEEEAVSLALYFVNMQGIVGDTEEIIRSMHILKDIMTIIQVHYKIQLNE
nr:PRD domain-containing protein [Entomospira entomophilus]